MFLFLAKFPCFSRRPVVWVLYLLDWSCRFLRGLDVFHLNLFLLSGRFLNLPSNLLNFIFIIVF